MQSTFLEAVKVSILEKNPLGLQGLPREESLLSRIGEEPSFKTFISLWGLGMNHLMFPYFLSLLIGSNWPSCIALCVFPLVIFFCFPFAFRVHL